MSAVQQAPIAYGRQDVSDEDIRAVVECLRGDFLTQGPRVAAFEAALTEATGARYAVAVANGTAALHLTYLAMGLGPGDVGVTSAVSFVASSNGMLYTGAGVAFADVDPTTGLIRPEDLEAVTERLAREGRKPIQITGEEARERVFRMRAQNDAILVGIGTVLADNPQLTCRLPGMLERSPVRVVLDAQLRTPLSLSVISTNREYPTWVFCAEKASQMAEDILAQKGVRVFRAPEANGRLDLAAVLKRLNAEGITRLMVEGGPTVAASFVSAGLVDEVALLRGAVTIGAGGLDALAGMKLDALTEGMTALGAEKLGVDTLEHYGRG